MVAVPNCQMNTFSLPVCFSLLDSHCSSGIFTRAPADAHQEMSITVRTAGQPLQDIKKQAPQLNLPLMLTWKMSTTLRTVSSSLFASHCSA